MAMPKFVNLAFTPRRLEMTQLVLQDALAYMASKKSTATAPAEIRFYETQTVQFQELHDLLGVRAAAGARAATMKVRLTAEQFSIVGSTVKNRNLREVLAINALPAGAEHDERFAAYGEWEVFANDLTARDPRRLDTSQDAEADEDEEAEEEAESA